jgi:hypothetical protein
MGIKEPSCATAAVVDYIHLCINLICDSHMLSVHLLSYITLYYLVTPSVMCVHMHFIKHVYSAIACCVVIDFDTHAAICCMLYCFHSMKHMGNKTNQYAGE